MQRAAGAAGSGTARPAAAAAAAASYVSKEFAMASRRVFLRNGGMALLSLGFAPTFLARTAAAVSTRTKLLIAIFQRGAVDGLNVVVPCG
jgi:uncharacterized protein (DUF1501 family)